MFSLGLSRSSMVMFLAEMGLMHDQSLANGLAWTMHGPWFFWPMLGYFLSLANNTWSILGLLGQCLAWNHIFVILE